MQVVESEPIVQRTHSNDGNFGLRQSSIKAGAQLDPVLEEVEPDDGKRAGEQVAHKSHVPPYSRTLEKYESGGSDLEFRSPLKQMRK